MKKQEFIKLVAANLETTQKDADEILEVVFETIAEATKEYEEVPLGVLGKMTTTKRAARKGRNPKTGEEIEIAATTVPKFKPSKQFRELIKG